MSKRKWNHPEADAGNATVAWRSPGQLQDSKEFRTWLEREFPQGAAEMADGEDAETSRRSFLKLMGASTALAGFGMAACRRPESYIVPYTKAPEWVIPGKATYYASSMPRAGGATPLVVTTFEGRPTKLGANSLHPDNEGTDAFVQASVLDLYSVSRSRTILKEGKKSSRKELDEVISALAKNTGAKVGFVFGADDCPTRTRLTRELAAKFSGAKFYQYEPLVGEAVLGDGVTTAVDFSKADRILSFDCDFTALDSQGPIRPFYDRRKPEGRIYDQKPNPSGMNRLYMVEAAFTLTGGIADHRLRVPASQIVTIAAQIAKGLGVNAASLTAAGEVTDPKHLEWIAALVEDLKANAGKSVVLAGSRLPAAIRQLAFEINSKLGNVGEGKPLATYRTEVTGLGTLANVKADIDSGAIDTLILLTPANPLHDAIADLGFADSFKKLKASIHLGARTDATAHASTWHIPAAHYLESWSDARSVRGTYTIVQPMILPLYEDCVSELELLLALLSEDGKLLNGEGEEGAASPAYTAVRTTFAAIGGEGDAPWKQLLRDGFIKDSGYAATEVSLPENVWSGLASIRRETPSTSSLDVIFSTDASVYDGRWIDNGWLQEAPDPVSKLSWDNAALISPQTAKDLGIYKDLVPLSTRFADRAPEGDDEGEHRTAPMIKLTVNGVTIEIPVLISFGQAENTIVIPLGYGQGFNDEDELERDTKNAAHVGLVGVNRGFDAYVLRKAGSEYYATGAKAEKIAKRYSVALVQEHNSMYGRALAREISTIKTDELKGDFAKQLAGVKKQGNDSHAPENISLYKQEGSSTWDPDKDGKAKPLLSDPLHQWAMAIDLSACTGCNACLIACQAENNIPIVGKEQVARGREMHWIRMDRYYAVHKDNDFDPGNPEMITQPVACVQCESAPCETVCPVNATVHTEDGLNAMAYNRCIGTRYCANNCPYKARRFNFFDYNKRNPLIAHNLNKGPFGEKQVGQGPHLQRNPNVTVRMRGVMEKCTYCVQRLKDSVIRQKRGQKQEVLASGQKSPEVQVTTNTLRVPVDSVKVACQDVCSAEAISFGNLLDGDKSTMVRAKNSERNYDLLNYIGTLPRTSYLARVKNPNEKMPDANFVGKATIDMV
jgi:MoCo/4Fe-4S cofactor protein with predicted Tat translocation signal